MAGPHPQSSAKTRHQIKKLKGCLCEFFFQMATIQVLGSVAVERVEVGLLACRLFGGSSLFSCLFKYLINIRTFIGCLTNKCGIFISSDRNIIDSPRLVSVLKRSPVDVFFYAARFNYNNGNVGGSSLPLSVNLLLEHRTKPLPLFGIGGGGMNNCFTWTGFHSDEH